VIAFLAMNFRRYIKKVAAKGDENFLTAVSKNKDKEGSKNGRKMISLYNRQRVEGRVGPFWILQMELCTVALYGQKLAQVTYELEASAFVSAFAFERINNIIAEFVINRDFVVLHPVLQKHAEEYSAYTKIDIPTSTNFFKEELIRIIAPVQKYMVKKWSANPPVQLDPNARGVTLAAMDKNKKAVAEYAFPTSICYSFT
jgi:hypothetical protein